MIFNKNYDRSLWLMLSGDEFNRSKIADIITNIPYDLYEKIRKLIENNNNDITEINYEKDNSKYTVTITSGTLNIKTIKLDEEEQEETKLFIFPVNEKELSEMELNSSIHLGGFSYARSARNMFTIGIGLEEYDIVKTLFGHCVKVYANNQQKAVDTRRVCEEKMPENIYQHQFKTQKGINRLVRGRRKK